MSLITKFICSLCGPADDPCPHIMEKLDLIILKRIDELTEKHHDCCRFIKAELLEIIHILSTPTSATLTLKPNPPALPGDEMPASVQVGGTANSLFQEWTGLSGTGTVVPNAGPVTYASDNTAVATVDSGTGVATGVAEGTANISGTDSTNGLTASDVLTVAAAPPPPAQSATLTLTAN